MIAKEQGEECYNMIAYVKGTVAYLNDNIIVVDVHDIGYQIFITLRDVQVMPAAGKEVCLHTYMNVKEDAMQLFGFLDKDDLAMFRLLLNVNGVGPKAALGILGSLSANDLRFAVLSDDVKSISAAPGIGKKTAQKLILELKDKVHLEDAFEKRLEHNTEQAGKVNNDEISEAVQALTALGYAASDALKAVKKVEITEQMRTEDILKEALKKISFL